MHPHGMKPARTRRAFLLCYAAYTAIYLARLNLSMASPVLKSDGTLTAAQIGLLGGIFSAVYAVGRLMNGARCDHVPPVRMIAGGLALASGANLLFGAFPPFAALAALWAVNALAQSMLWSAILRVIAALYAPDDAQRKASLMITSVAVGNVAGIAVNTALLRGSASAAFRVPGGVLALLCGGALMLLRGIGSESSDAAGRLSIRTLAAPLHRPAVRRMLLPALLHGVMKDNISLWMTVYLTDRFAMQLTQSAGYVLLIPLVGLAGRLLYPAAARGLRSDSRTASAGFALCAAASLPLALHIPSPWASVSCLSLLYAAVSLVNTYVLSVFPMSFAADGCAASVSGLLDFATYLGAGLSAVVYGVVIEHIGYAPMFASWAVLAILSLIRMRKVK